MTKSENKNIVERHGCIVCARTFKVLAMYTLDDELVGCVVTGGPGGHCMPGERQPLVACDTHTAEDIEAAYARWQSRNEKDADDEQEDE